MIFVDGAGVQGTAAASFVSESGGGETDFICIGTVAGAVMCCGCVRWVTFRPY